MFSHKIFAKNILSEAEWSNENRLILTFKNDINSKNVKGFSYYEKSSKNYRYFYNLKNFVIPNGHYPIKDQAVDYIKISQHSSNLARVAITNKNKIKIIYKFNKNKIIFDFVKNSKEKSTTTQEVLKNNKSNPYSKTLVKSKYVAKKGKYVITVDAGHGGKDAGAVGSSMKEKEIVLSVAKYLKFFLEKKGHKVHLTRSSDKFISLHKRTKIANQRESDIFVSIHVNSIPRKGNYRRVNGIETYFLSDGRRLSEKAKRVAAKENYQDLQEMNKYSKDNVLHIFNREKIFASHRLAIDVQNNILNYLRKFYNNVKDSGVREGPFWVLLGAEMPSILVEIGFINGSIDSKRLDSTTYKKRMANGIANGIDAFLNKNFK
jgi:N-acetylmuramoyl-L-alanine amidase